MQHRFHKRILSRLGSDVISLLVFSIWSVNFGGDRMPYLRCLGDGWSNIFNLRIESSLVCCSTVLEGRGDLAWVTVRWPSLTGYQQATQECLLVRCSL